MLSCHRWFVRLLLTLGLLCSLAAAQARDVRVGVYANEPKIFVNPAGQADGIFVDLLQVMAGQDGWTLQFVPCEWQECLTALEAGRIDLMPDVAYSAEREKRFDFHQTAALNSWSQIYRRRDVPIANIFELTGKRVAVLEGAIQVRLFSELMASFGVKAKLLPAASLDDAFAMVAAGDADAVIANNLFGTLHAPRYKLDETAIVFQPARLFFATGKGRNKDLLDAIDRHLQAWLGDSQSVYSSVLKKWAGRMPESAVPRYFWWGLAGVASLLLLTFLLVVVLRRQVSARTRHLMIANEEVSRFKAIFDHATFAAWIAGMDGRLNYVNAHCASLAGQAPEALIGQGFMTLYAPAQRKAAEEFWQAVRDGRDSDISDINELWQLGKDGRSFPMLTSGILLKDSAGRPALLACTAVDISDRKEAEAKIRQLAFFDPLTGLPNRRLLTDHLKHALAVSGRHDNSGALLFLDLDQFKTINDTLGHDQGDQLLQEVATRIQSHIRMGDTVARLGGDEFIVLLEDLNDQPDIAASQAEGVGKKVMAALRQPYKLAGFEHYCTPSIGITLFRQGKGTVDELLKQADLAMYQAKAAGRNTLRFFDPQMQAVVEVRAALESDLRAAVQALQFSLYIQPQVDAHTGVFGAEALLRWRHPQRGWVSPTEFIPVAEDCGLIHTIGQWVLEAACQQLVAWAAQPALKNLSLAVNVSVQQFRHPEFVSQVLGTLQRTGARPDRLKLEITESLLMVSVEDVIAKMDILRGQGVGFSLDDFGTGYSSLTYLKRLPLDQVKIDASFVRDLLTDPNDAAIVRSIVALAKSLNLMVVAEGVETQEQCDVLAAENCHAYQGYLFSRALPPEEFVRYVTQALS